LWVSIFPDYMYLTRKLRDQECVYIDLKTTGHCDNKHPLKSKTNILFYVLRKATSTEKFVYRIYLHFLNIHVCIDSTNSMFTIIKRVHVYKSRHKVQQHILKGPNVSTCILNTWNKLVWYLV